MTKTSLTIVLVLAMILAGRHSYGQQPDDAGMRQVIDKFYRVLSFSDTTAMRLDSLPVLFTQHGKLVAAFGNEVTAWTAAEFVTYLRKSLTAQQATARNERQLHAKTEWFGNIAHVFSTYDLTVRAKGQIFTRRGINSIQLVKQNGNWNIVSLTWDRESDMMKLPPRYLHD